MSTSEATAASEEELIWERRSPRRRDLLRLIAVKEFEAGASSFVDVGSSGGVSIGCAVSIGVNSEDVVADAVSVTGIGP